MEHSGPHAGHTAPAGTTYNITLQTSAPPQAAEPVEISLVVTEQRIGEPLSEFELLHDRLVHLIIVNEPLTYFAHLHPALENGVFRIGHTFPAEGLYKLWAEVKPAGSESVLVAFRLSVSGSASASAAIDASSDLGYHVKLSPAGPAPQHQPVELVFEVSDPDGRPVTDLEPLMAAGGHCVVISSDLRDFIHVHPLEDVDSGWRGGPRVRFLTRFERPLRHGVWGQFQHRGRVITSAFTLDVVEASGHH